eukprot:516840-Rhodomonas_salina.4
MAFLRQDAASTQNEIKHKNTRPVHKLHRDFVLKVTFLSSDFAVKEEAVSPAAGVKTTFCPFLERDSVGPSHVIQN